MLRAPLAGSQGQSDSQLETCQLCLCSRTCSSLHVPQLDGAGWDSPGKCIWKSTRGVSDGSDGEKSMKTRSLEMVFKGKLLMGFCAVYFVLLWINPGGIRLANRIISLSGGEGGICAYI